MRRPLYVSLIAIVVIAFGLVGANMAAGNEPQLGLDLQGGASVVLQPRGEFQSDSLDQAIAIIRSRVDALGVAEPEITRQGDSIVVQLPGVKDQRRALEIVGDTAELRFRPVLEILPPEGVEIPELPTPSSSVPTDESTSTSAGEDGDDASTTTSAEVTPEDTTEVPRGETTTTTTTTAAPAGEESDDSTTTSTEATTPTTVGEPGEIETTPREEDDPTEVVIFPGRPGDDDEPPLRYRLGPATVTGEALSTAQALFNEQNGQWVVNVEFTGSGIDQFNAVASQCFNGDPSVCPTRSLAIVLDAVVQSAPEIQAPEFQRDEVQISGDFDEGDARDLALVLRFGALPVALEQETVQTISPSLGRESLEAGVAAGLVGVGLVLLYMILYYRALGLVVVLGLLVWGALMWGVISYLGSSSGLALTLAGATGIIVSVGITVDSYVVFFERLKDEVRSGKTIRSSVERGFTRAFRTILTADVSSFMGAALLYWLTVGPVRGFAFFLGLSTMLDVVVAFFFTRPMVTLLSRSRAFTEMRGLGVARGLARPEGGAA